MDGPKTSVNSNLETSLGNMDSTFRVVGRTCLCPVKWRRHKEGIGVRLVFVLLVCLGLILCRMSYGPVVRISDSPSVFCSFLTSDSIRSSFTSLYR